MPFILILIAILSLLIPLNGSNSDNFSLGKIEETALQAQTKWVLNLLQSRHYLKDEISRVDGAAVIENFTNRLDYSKLYFLKEDIDDYHFRFAKSVERFLENGNLYPAFSIYQEFSTRFISRTEWAIARLEQPFSFDNAASFDSDRSESLWMKTKEEADQTWNLYIKYQVLNELLSSTTELLDEDVNEDEKVAQLKRLLIDKDFYDARIREVIKKLKRRYQRNLKLLNDRAVSDIQESFINAMTHVFDPHSSFLSTHTLENFNSAVKNSFVGIGAQLEDIDGICTIKDILPGGPAERSNQLKANDEIIGVAQGDGPFDDVIDMSLTYIVRKIKGPKDSVVRLLIRPGDTSDPSKRTIVALTRDEVKLTANLASAKVLNLPMGESFASIGIIKLPSFYGNIGYGSALGTTSEDVAELIKKLKSNHQIDGLILDLRTNGGGLLSEAVRLAGLFIPVGPIVQVVDARGKKQVLHDQSAEIAWTGPLAILTSKFSASASEIVAGALKDHERALIIGDSSTHGKGTVQEVYNMHSRFSFNWFQANPKATPPVASKITIKQFFLPMGSSTQLRGVESDVVLPSMNEILPVAESDLDNPIDWKKIEAINWYNNWKKINVSSPYQDSLVSHLLNLSDHRQNSMEELLYLKDDIDWRTKSYTQTLVSLNLQNRIQEQVKKQAYQLSLENRYETLKSSPYPYSEVLLNIREEQEKTSKSLIDSFNSPVISEMKESAESPSTLPTDPPKNEEESYDIYLRESARILRDWVLWEKGLSNASASLPLL